MKKISAAMVAGVFVLITIFKAHSQANTIWQKVVIKPYHVSVAFSKTTNIVFPYPIISVDIGSRDVLAQKAKGVENILQIKAAKKAFLQTNISIITADGQLTSFLVDYAEEPPILNLSLSVTGKQFLSSIFSEIINQEQVEHHAAAALASLEKVRGIKDKEYGIILRLNGLFIHNNIMLLRLHIVNETNIDYDIDQLRLYIRDLKKAKRTATQEIEMSPLFVSDSTRKITGQSGKTIVMAVPKFTIPDKKYLALQLMEKNGGRHLEVHIKNKKIVKAAQID